MKNRILITGLATATILSAAALNQLSPSVFRPPKVRPKI